jgi:F-type H+-transporting ATPase subunit epsilon
MVDLPTFRVSVLTQEKVHLQSDAVHMQVPGGLGYLGVLANHAPLLSTLKPGKLTVSLKGGKEEIFAVSGGLLKVADNEAVILAEAVEKPDEIDLERAVQAKERAEERLKARQMEIDLERAAAALDRALNRIHIRRDYSEKPR